MEIIRVEENPLEESGEENNFGGVMEHREIQPGFIYVDRHDSLTWIEEVKNGVGYGYWISLEGEVNKHWGRKIKQKDLEGNHPDYIFIASSLEELPKFKEQTMKFLGNPEALRKQVQENKEEKGLVALDVNHEALIESNKRQMEKMEAHRRMAEMMVSQISALVSQVRDRLSYYQTILNVLETYLGIYEEAELIQDGEPADISEPITFRQLVLFMDEEVGDIELKRTGQLGIDFQNVEEFDEWLLKPENLQKNCS